MQKDSHKASREGLDEYIRVSSPGLLIIVGALSLVLVATVIWGFSGKIPVTLTVTGCVVDSELASRAEASYPERGAATEGDQKAWVVCYVDSSKYSAEQITKFGDNVTIRMPDRTTFKGKIEIVSPNPMSREEAGQYLQDGEWVAEQCVSSDYSWGIAIRIHDDISDHMFTTPQVTIITDEFPPIRFLAR